MIKKLCLMTLFSGVTLMSFAQTEAELLPDKPKKGNDHFIGIQANPLFNELLSFGSNTPVNNPFLLKWGIRNQKGNELLFGLGYTYNLDKDEETDDKSTFNQFDFRVGYSHKKMLNERFEFGIGVDAVLNFFNSTTISESENFNGFSKNETKEKGTSYGLGPQMTLAFNLGKNIQIGTEATYYMRFTKSKFNSESVVTVIDDFDGSVFTTTNTSEFELSNRNLQLNLPVALFLIFKL